jgi:hypothetical protein
MTVDDEDKFSFCESLQKMHSDLQNNIKALDECMPELIALVKKLNEKTGSAKSTCCKDQDQKYMDPTLGRLHSKECIEKEIKWLEDNKEEGLWIGIMTWNERIKQLRDLINNKVPVVALQPPEDGSEMKFNYS